LIQIFLDNRIITGKKAINVPTMQIKAVTKDAFSSRNEITNAAAAKTIPTA
jgi:hypothetical protein